MTVLRVHQFVENSNFLLVILMLLIFIYIYNWFDYFILTVCLYLDQLKDKYSKLFTRLNHIVKKTNKKNKQNFSKGEPEVFLSRCLILLDFRKTNMDNLLNAWIACINQPIVAVAMGLSELLILISVYLLVLLKLSYNTQC